MVAPLFYFFFAVFPTRSPLDRRLPWLKWIGLAVGVLWRRRCASWDGPPADGTYSRVVFSLWAHRLGLCLADLECLQRPHPGGAPQDSSDSLGDAGGLSCRPCWSLGANDFFGFHAPPLLVVAVVVLLWLFPLSFAYAVVKHRVLEIPVLLRRSARYLLVQRGFTILLSLLSVGVVWIFALSFARYLEPLTGAALPGGIALGTAFGSLLLWTGTRVHKRVGERIDRAFFRSAYDARMILQDLAEKTRTATDRQELAALLDHHLNQALQPSSLAVYLETRDHQISALRGNVPPELQTIPVTPAIMAELARHGRMERYSGIPSTWEVSAESPSGTTEPFLLAPLQARLPGAHTGTR